MNDPFSPEALQKYSHATPFFLFSKERLVENYKAFTTHFPGAVIHYAMKANSEPEILQTLYDAGASFEAASVHELSMLSHLDIKPDRIIYGTSVKPASHIKTFKEYGVDRFVFDSAPELEKIAAVAPGSRVFVRMNVNDTGSVFKFSEKFGTTRDNVVPLLIRARELGLIPYGVSFNVGSQASNPKAWGEAIDSLVEPLDQLKELGIEIQILDIGGGHPCLYDSSDNHHTIEDIALATYEAYDRLPYKPQLLLEPGRAIVADAGILVTNVIALVERKENTWLFLDAGVYNALFEAMAYQGSTRYKVRSMRTSYDTGESLFALAGPTGDSQDVITREALLPADMNVGDKLIFYSTGAYSLVVSNPFNGFPKPDVFYV